MEEGRDYAFPLSGLSKNEFPEPIDLLSTFKEELEAIGGNVFIEENFEGIKHRLSEIITEKSLGKVFCIDDQVQQAFSGVVDFTETQEDFEAMQAAVTQCECLISRTGTVVVNASHPSGRRLNAFPPIHFIWAKYSQLVSTPHEAMEWLDNKFGNDLPSLVSFITGASRTADIEKTLVMGAHGPKEIYVFIDKNG